MYEPDDELPFKSETSVRLPSQEEAVVIRPGGDSSGILIVSGYDCFATRMEFNTNLCTPYPGEDSWKPVSSSSTVATNGGTRMPPSKRARAYRAHQPGADTHPHRTPKTQFPPLTDATAGHSSMDPIEHTGLRDLQKHALLVLPRHQPTLLRGHAPRQSLFPET